jgi:hypothetical protein
VAVSMSSGLPSFDGGDARRLSSAERCTGVRSYALYTASGMVPMCFG